VPPLERKRDAEDCLDQQAAYDVDHGPHAGFVANVCMPRGTAQNECPGWPSVGAVVDGCLQSMFEEGPPPSEPCEGDCFLRHGHFLNMTNPRYTHVACGLHEADGEVWAVQNFF
jgi:hypothetical protein